MKILRNLKVPTGNILVVEGSKGKLECLSLGDYGREKNVKADFLGLERDIDKVEHGVMLPLEKKWVITTSSQYGCGTNCLFCDVPKVGAGINCTHEDIIEQVLVSRYLHPEVKETERLNHHHARMGEPTWNPAVLTSTVELAGCLSRHFMPSGHVVYHPVVSTMMPRYNHGLEMFLQTWCTIKNEVLHGEAGLQLSINSTNEYERNEMFRRNQLPLDEIKHIVSRLPEPKGRKYTLNFAIAGWEIDAEYLASIFDPKHWICKLTPMHKTATAIEHDIKTEGDYTSIYPYLKDEQNLKDAGFDVLVFVASEYEDLGRITCGNAILSGTLPLVPYEEV